MAMCSAVKEAATVVLRSCVRLSDIQASSHSFLLLSSMEVRTSVNDSIQVGTDAKRAVSCKVKAGQVDECLQASNTGTDNGSRC